MSGTVGTIPDTKKRTSGTMLFERQKADHTQATGTIKTPSGIGRNSPERWPYVPIIPRRPEQPEHTPKEAEKPFRLPRARGSALSVLCPRLSFALAFGCARWALHRAGTEQDRAVSVHPTDLSRSEYQDACLRRNGYGDIIETKPPSNETQGWHPARQKAGWQGMTYFTRSGGNHTIDDAPTSRLRPGRAAPGIGHAVALSSMADGASPSSCAKRQQTRAFPCIPPDNPRALPTNGRAKRAIHAGARANREAGLESWCEGVAGRPAGKLGARGGTGSWVAPYQQIIVGFIPEFFQIPRWMRLASYRALPLISAMASIRGHEKQARLIRYLRPHSGGAITASATDRENARLTARFFSGCSPRIEFAPILRAQQKIYRVPSLGSSPMVGKPCQRCGSPGGCLMSSHNARFMLFFAGQGSSIVFTATGPVNTVAPAVTGTETEGETLSVTDGTWTGAATISYTYQWYQALTEVQGVGPPLTDDDGNYLGVAISSATNSTYVLQAGDVGELIFCDVTATNSVDSVVKSSNVTGVISAATVTIRDALDGLSGISGAWSTWQKLLTAYSGNVIRVRRDSDDAATNIGFSGDVLDEAAVATHLGGANGFWNTLFDQSGNTRDYEQNVSAIQPAYTAAGPQSRPSANFDGTDDMLPNATPFSDLISNSTGYMVCAMRADAIATNDSFSFNNAGPVGDATGYLGISLLSAGGGTVRSWNYDGSDDHADGAFSTTTVHVVEWRHEGGNIYCRVDGASETSVASGNTDASGMAAHICLGKAGGVPFDGQIFDLITFSTIPSSGDRDAIVAALLDGLQ